MKILLDECTPHVLKKLLTGFEIKTVQDQGWGGITNGALLTLAEKEFDVLITSDQNLKYQQNLSRKQVAVIQLPSNQVPTITRLATVIQETLETIDVGDLIEIPLPTPLP